MEKKFYSLPNVSVRNKIPVPPRKPLPLDDVPMWLQLPYDTKYPLSECSKTAVTLTTEELGKSLYHTFPRKDFELSSSPIPRPETSFYNSLHDPHLRRYFLSPFRYKHLLTKGLVTEDGKVKSHVQEHNHYRMFLYHLWALEVNQLERHQMSEERNCFETMLQARKSEDPLFKKFAEKYDRINTDEILEEAATEISQNKKLVDEHGVTPFVRATLQWKIHQQNLQKNYRKHYPAIKQWLSDKTKHYKRLMEIKLNAGRNRDKKLRIRWEKIYESSRARLERDMKLRELERERKRALAEQRYDKVKRLWAENDRALKERKKKKTTDLPGSFTSVDSALPKWITSDSESSPSPKTSEPDMLHTDLDDGQVAKSTFSEEYNTEKVHVPTPEISKTDKVKKEFDDSMEITNTSLQQKEDNKLLKISDRKLTIKVPLKEEKKLQQIVDMYTKETEEDTKKGEVLKKGNYLKKEDEEPTLPVQSKGLEYKDNTDSKSIQKLKPQLGFVEQSELINFLYGLPDVTKSNKSESDDYSIVTEKADDILGKTNARNLETTEKLDNSTSHSFKTPLKEDSARSGPVIKKEKLEDSTSHSFKTSLKENSVRSEPVVKKEKLEDSTSHSFKTSLKENSARSEPVVKREKFDDFISHSLTTSLKKNSVRFEPVVMKEKLEDSTSHSFKTSLKENSVRSESVVKREKLDDFISHSFKTSFKENSAKSEPVIKKTDEISDKNSASSPEITKKHEDSKSNSFKIPLEEILGGYGYEEYGDVWKALDNLYEERKRKFQGIVGLDELKIKQWRNEKIKKELYESKTYLPFSVQHKKHATLEKYPTVHTLDESTLKTYETGSESNLDDKRILKRIFTKQKFDNIIIENEHRIRNVQSLQKRKLGKNISKTVLSPKSEKEQKVKMDYSRSDILYKAKKNMLDADLLILRRKAHFTGKGISKIGNMSDTRIKDFKSDKIHIPQMTITTPNFTQTFCKRKNYSKLDCKKEVTDLHTPHTTVIKSEKEKNFSPDLSYMQSKSSQTHQFINKTTTCGKEDSEFVEKYLASLVDAIILKAEVPKIRERKTSADGIQKITSKLDHKLLFNNKLTQNIKDNCQKAELKFNEKDVATSDSSKMRDNDDDKGSSMSEKTDSENSYFTSTDFECNDTECGIIEHKDENLEKDSIGEFEPSFINGDTDKKIAAEDASLCTNLTTMDRSNTIKDLQTKKEISKIDSILQKSANRQKESLTDNIQKRTDTFIKLQISTPNETLNILDNKDLLHSTKNKDVCESVNQKEIYNYLSAKAPEYFGYLDDTLKKEQDETFSKFITTEEKDLILPSDVKSIDVTDVNENTVRFQPITIVTDIERRRPEEKFTITLDSHHGTKTNNGQKQELAIAKSNTNKEITHNDSSNFLLDANYDKINIQSTSPERLNEKYAFLEQAKGKDHEIKYFQQTEAETTAQTQPKQKEKENAKLPDFEIQQNIASLNAVSSAFIYNIDLTRDVDGRFSDDHFHRIKFSKIAPSSDIDGNNAISIQSEEETKSTNDEEVPKTELPVKRDLEDISDTKATTSEIKDVESTLPISDIPKMGAETEVSICSNYESEKQMNMHRIQHPLFDSRCSLTTPMSSKRYFEEYSEQTDLTPDRTVDHTDESLTGAQTVSYNKDINQNSNRQFSKEDNLEIDFTDNSITANFEIPKSVINTNLDEKSLKLFLKECISNITQEFRKKKYSSLTQIEPIADTAENGSKDTLGIQKKASNVLASTYRTIRNGTLPKKEEIRTENSNTDNNASESKTTLSHNNIEDAKFFSEYPIENKYLDVTALTESNINEEIHTKDSDSDHNASESKTSLSRNNIENDKIFSEYPIENEYLNVTFLTESSVNEETCIKDSDSDNNASESKTTLSHNNIEDAKIFSEYPIEDEYLDVTALTEDENQSTDSSENNAYQNFDSNGNKDDALETEACKLFFNDQFASSKPNVKTCPSKYVYAQQNKEIMSIASEKVKNIEQYFKTNKIRTTFTNVDEIIIADDTEDEIKICEEKTS